MLRKRLTRRFTGLWRHADFMRLWIGQTISGFGTMIGGAAMDFTAILVLQASPIQLGILTATRLLPGFLTGLIAGVWVDRSRRRPIMVGVDIGRAVLLASIPLAYLFGVLRIEQLFIVTFTVSVLAIFFDVAYQTYLPSLIRSDELVEGNSKLSASASVSEFAGFALAGWLVQLFTAPLTILIDAVSFIVSAVSVRMIRTPERVTARNDQPNLLREAVEGLRVVWRSPLLRVMAAAIFTQSFFGGMYGVLVVLYMARDLGFATGILGTIWAVGGISSLIGALAAEPVTRRWGIGPVMVGGLLLSCLSGFLIPMAQGATLISALLLILAQVSDGAMTIYQISQLSLRQAITSEGWLGRVNASAQFLGLGATLAGSLIGGLLGEAYGARGVLFLGAGGSLLSVLLLACSSIRSLHTAPEQAVAGIN